MLSLQWVLVYCILLFTLNYYALSTCSVNFSSLCSLFITLFTAHPSVHLTSLCSMYITLYTLHNSVLFTSLSSLYITLAEAIKYAKWNLQVKMRSHHLTPIKKATTERWNLYFVVYNVELGIAALLGVKTHTVSLTLWKPVSRRNGREVASGKSPHPWSSVLASCEREKSTSSVLGPRQFSRRGAATHIWPPL